ncbi:hypothetical protein DN590_25615 [Citrobacter freundii]|nr:hypothetical protein BED42_24990 [Citrobacter portucalensis]RWT87863.1 hypothetical protein DN590_25615 [Citrobacter freundii]
MGLILMSLHDKILNHDVNELDHRDILHKQTDILPSVVWKTWCGMKRSTWQMGSQKSKKPA